MRSENITSVLNEELAKRGWQAKILSSEHIQDLQAEIDSQYRRGLFDEEFYEEELTGFDFKMKTIGRNRRCLNAVKIARLA